MTDWARFERAIELRDSGRIEDALGEIDALIDETSVPEDKASLILNKATCLLLLKRPAEARRELDESGKYLDEESALRPRLEFLDASVSLDEGSPIEALQKLDHMLTNHTKLLAASDMRDLYEKVQMTRSMLLVDLKRSTEARPFLEEALSYSMVDVERAKVSYYLGLCYFDLGELNLAKQRFQDALNLGIDERFLPHTHFYLGLIFERQSAGAWAIQHFEACRTKLGQSNIPPKRVYEHLYALHRAVGNRKEAEHYETLANERDLRS